MFPADPAASATDMAMALSLERKVCAFLTLEVFRKLQCLALARALDYVEALLPLDAQTRAMSEEIAAVLTRFLRGRGVVSPHLAARDIAAMTRGLIDAAGLVGETDDAVFLARLRSAIMGYLTVAGSS